jgi:hypothetical protein
MVSDGRYAKDAIRNRLAAARASEASMVEIFESAKVKLERASDEVRAAEEMLKEAEMRWPEIEIDDEESTVSPPSKKRKKDAASSTRGIVVVAAAATGGIVAAAYAGQGRATRSRGPTATMSSRTTTNSRSGRLST